jgi:hypothetical protein
MGGGKGFSRHVLLLAVLLCSVGALAAEFPEYEIKAEFIERFTRFIEWPPAAFPPPDRPFVVCNIGSSPIEGYLRSLVTTRKIKNRPAELRLLSRPDDIDGCHIVVIARSERGELGRILGRTAHRPILTVGDGSGFAEQGVLISFTSETSHVRFDINADAAKASGLQFSAQLLRVGRIVGGAR